VGGRRSKRVESGLAFYRVDGGGPPMILLHGRYSTHRAWFQQVPTLSHNRTVVTYDAPGFGASLSDQPPRLALHVHDLVRLRRHLGYDRVTLVGQSMGGFVALQHALAHPKETAALVLTGSAAGVADPQIVTAIRASVARHDQEPAAHRAFAPSFVQRRPDLAHFALVERDASPTLDEEFLTPLLEGGGPSAAELAQLAVPTLIIAGEHDILMPAEALERLGALLPGAEIEVIRNAGHCAYLEQPGAYNSAILNFLERVGA